MQIAETLLDIGTDLLVKKSLDGAIKYLRWSWDYISRMIRSNTLCVEGRELSTTIRHNLCKALMRRGQNDEMDLERAGELLDGLALV
jgi:prefoldin subunit 5